MLCDLHIHTALSPCADNDMTPNNIVNMAVLSGLDAIAITDHNSTGNVRAAMRAAQNAEAPLIVLPGVEAESSEEIHTVCLFDSLGAADVFGEWLRDGLPGIKNKPDIFGEQLLFDEYDSVTGELSHLLVTATRYGIADIINKARDMGGVAYPAHIDRESNGILSVLGAVPPELMVRVVEVSKNAPPGFLNRPGLGGLAGVGASDAHRLHEIGENPFTLINADHSAAGILRSLKGL